MDEQFLTIPKPPVSYDFYKAVEFQSEWRRLVHDKIRRLFPESKVVYDLPTRCYALNLRITEGVLQYAVDVESLIKSETDHLGRKLLADFRSNGSGPVAGDEEMMGMSPVYDRDA